MTFDVTPDGLVAGGAQPRRADRRRPCRAARRRHRAGRRLLGCCATGSFAGLALTVMPWLLSGGTLALHHGFDADAFAAQCREERCDTRCRAGRAGAAARRGRPAGSRRTEERARGLARAGAAHGQPGLAASGASADRHAGLRRDRADRLAPRCRRPAGPAAGRRGDGAARRGQRRAGRRDRAHRDRHARAARPDGAAPSLPARRRARARRTSRPTPRLRRYLLSLPASIA